MYIYSRLMCNSQLAGQVQWHRCTSFRLLTFYPAHHPEEPTPVGTQSDGGSAGEDREKNVDLVLKVKLKVYGHGSCLHILCPGDSSAFLSLYNLSLSQASASFQSFPVRVATVRPPRGSLMGTMIS